MQLQVNKNKLPTPNNYNTLHYHIATNFLQRKVTSIKNRLGYLRMNLLTKIPNLTTKLIQSRPIHTSLVSLAAKKPPQPLYLLHGITKDRSQVIPLETSLKYMKSAAYQEAYGNEPVWKYYRRNHKGMYPPKKTRKTCIRARALSTGNPCPICRDEYLVLHEENVGLLKQFICPHTGSILSYKKTGICQKKYEQLLIVIARAKDVGLITFDVPFRAYDYSEYS